MFEDLGKLIIAIQNNYDRICDIWSNIASAQINLKKKQVIDARENAEIIDSIWKYRALVNDEIINIMFNLNMIDYEKSSVTSRVKAQNSIEFKLDNYVTNHEYGKIPLKKCMNDLLGIRIIIDDIFTYDDIKEFMDKNFPTYKCIDSSKLSYVATHLYFENGNTFFPWELQIWMKKDERNNFASHKEYKQDYTKWERENRGGVENDQTFYDFE
ncbi:MAG: hypothetical protein II312_12700 [Lachnospiraceae bacterium]|nr:hypothetical protein [Lachnospiraceae bacterium]